MNVLGTEGLYNYLRTYKLNMPSEAARIIKATDVMPWSAFIHEKNKDRISMEGLDLLSKMLVYDKNKRITPSMAMQHPFFEPIRELIE